MFIRNLWYFGALILAGIVVVGCTGASSETTPGETPDLVATQVAVEKAAAATLTAEALAQQDEVAEAPAPTDEPAAPEAPSPTPSPANGQTTGDEFATPPTETATPPPSCTVVADGLNLRPGPAIEFEPPIATLLQDTVLVPLARNADSTWIEVQPQNSGAVGWVNTGAQFISCNIDVTALPLGQIPPTPTPLPTATFTPTPVPPTPTDAPPAPPQRVDVPVDGGRADLRGNIGLPGFTEDEIIGPDNEVIFRDRLVFQVIVSDPDEGNYDGAGIENVNIKIFGPDEEKVHERTENVAGYCVFGGGEPDCNVFSLQDYDRWPEEGQRPIEDGFHRVQADITYDGDRVETWNWSFWIDQDN